MDDYEIIDFTKFDKVKNYFSNYETQYVWSPSSRNARCFNATYAMGITYDYWNSKLEHRLDH